MKETLVSCQLKQIRFGIRSRSHLGEGGTDFWCNFATNFQPVSEDSGIRCGLACKDGNPRVCVCGNGDNSIPLISKIEDAEQPLNLYFRVHRPNTQVVAGFVFEIGPSDIGTRSMDAYCYNSTVIPRPAYKLSDNENGDHSTFLDMFSLMYF